MSSRLRITWRVYSHPFGQAINLLTTLINQSINRLSRHLVQAVLNLIYSTYQPKLLHTARMVQYLAK